MDDREEVSCVICAISCEKTHEIPMENFGIYLFTLASGKSIQT